MSVKGDDDTGNKDDQSSDSGNDDSGDKGDKGEPEVKFSQAQVDQIIAKRLKRFEGFDDLKTKASKFDEMEAEKLGEVERLTKDRDEWKSKTEELSKAHRSALMRAAVVAEASKVGANNPTLVFSVLDKSSLTVDDEGNVTGVTEAIAGLKKSDDYLFGSKTQRMGDAGGGTRQGSEGDPTVFTRTMIRDPDYFQKHEKAILKAMAEGRITDE